MRIPSRPKYVMLACTNMVLGDEESRPMEKKEGLTTFDRLYSFF